MTQRSRAAFEVAVVGGGIAGLAIAWRAAQRGLRVVVCDGGDRPGSASRVAAGMLAPVSEASLAERDLLDLTLRGAALWPAFADDLAEVSGLPVELERAGTLIVARDRDEAEALERELAARAELGLGVERLLASAARRAEPALAPTVRLAARAADDHAVDPRAVLVALRRALDAAGVEQRGDVCAIRCEGEAVTGVELGGGERIAAANVIVAAGSWSGAIPGLPDDARVPVRPVKGQILRLRDPAGPGLVSEVIRMVGRGYLVPRADGRYVLGATVEELGRDTRATAGPVHELLRDAIELVPGIAELELEEIGVGLRPGTPDNLPIIGRGALGGLHWATGHYRNGILLAPLTAELVVAGLEASAAPPAAVDPQRFAAVGAAR